MELMMGNGLIKMKKWNINCIKCGKFILTEQQEELAGDIKCVAGDYENGYYDETQDVFYCKECAEKYDIIND